MFRTIFFSILLTLASAGAANATPASPEPDQLEQCGSFVRVAPWCGESLEFDTRQLQAMQAFTITLSASAREEWQSQHRERRRGVAFTRTNASGEQELAGRPVIAAVFRVILCPPGTCTDPLLSQAVISQDGATMAVLLPAEGNFVGWTAVVLSSEGRHALLTNGELVRLGGRHRTDGNLSLDMARLPSSLITSTLLVQRGDGNAVVETLEATFIDHSLIRDRDGGTRVYSGLLGTFTTDSPDGTSVAMAYSNCRTVGQRLVERANLRADSTTILAAPATMGLSLAPQGFSILKAALSRSCR